MLVLSRHEGEVICIGNDVRIEVVGIRNGKVRIGIEAPKGIEVHRLEVFEAIHGKAQRTEVQCKRQRER